MKPRLLRGGLSGRVYVVMRYRELQNGGIQAHTKYDVTEDFDILDPAESGLREALWGIGYMSETMTAEAIRKAARAALATPAAGSAEPSDG